MGNALNRTAEYRDWLKELKLRVRQAQLKAAVQVNSTLLTFYWEMGGDIVERQKDAKWGSGFLKQLSHDLMAEFPDMKGFSKRNLERIRKWHLFYAERFINCDTACVAIAQQPASQWSESPEVPNVEQPVPQLESQLVTQLIQIPWGHNLSIVSKCADVEDAIYYVGKTIELNWSRSVLVHQIEKRSFSA